MADKNGEKVRLARCLAAALESVELPPAEILKDLETSYPALRRFLVGTNDRTAWHPAGSIYVSRAAKGIRVVLRIAAFELTAVYNFEKGADALETLEADLDLGTVPWDKTFQAQKREEKSRLAAVRYS